MPLNVLVVPDKFKGTLTAGEAARAIQRGWRRVRSEDTLNLLPMSDGGDGFGEIISGLLGAQPQWVKAVDAAHRRCKVCWWWEPETQLAVIESAKAIGLAMLPPGEFHPFQLDTRGVGTVLRAALARGAEQILIGIGGSSTNDGGFGMARLLGWKFLDNQAKPIERWTDLAQLAEIQPPKRVVPAKIVVAVDVQNPLLGSQGATRIYGPQKGLRASDFRAVEACLRQLAKVMKAQFKRDLAEVPGAGAAGGLGFGLFAFLGARPEPGFELFARHAQLNRTLRRTDLVITAEGAIDSSTLMGKGAGQVAQLCRDQEIPCIGLAGVAARSRALNKLFSQVHALTDLTPPDDARTRAGYWLERVAERAAAQAKA